MSKVLYITANPKKQENSYSLTVGDEFIKECRLKNPYDVVTSIDLYNFDIANLDADMINCIYGIISEEMLSEEKRKNYDKLKNAVSQFIEHDKYIFVTPLWNLSVPPVVRTYFDNISIVGKTFIYTENGPVGLLKNKKALHIQASGGIYSNGVMKSYEHGASYIKSILGILGVTELEQIFIEGVDIKNIDKESIKKQAIEEAKKLAKVF